jgi:D-amino-acid dehydrogenase
MTEKHSLTVAVIGAGIVGLCAALETQRLGHRVILIEPDEPGGTQAASYGNGTWLTPGSIMPVSLPGLWRKVPGYLMDPTGPFVIRWRDMPRLAGWLVRFVAAGRNWDLVKACATHRFELCKATVGDHAALAAEAGVPDLIRRNGLMYVYPDRSHFIAESRTWALRSGFGVRHIEIGEAELRRLQPELGPAYTFGIRLPDAAQVSDPGAYCAALARLLIARGGERVTSRATGFDISNGRLKAVRTSGAPVSCDRAIIAAGIASRTLAHAAGDRVPLISERGYHVVVPDPGFDIPMGLMPCDGQMAVVMTPQGLRVAGQVELADVSAPPDWRRADILVGWAKKMFPGLAGRLDAASVQRWKGNRPSTPDGLPCVGPAALTPDIVHCFGHGHTGLIQAPATGRLAAALVTGAPPPIDPAPFSARRFSA